MISSTASSAPVGELRSTPFWQAWGCPLGWTGGAAVIITVITVIRVLVLISADHTLYPDEAQYWSWAKALDWGYFSKPPLVAWIIAATTGLFGDAEAAVRLASPLLHAATAILVGATASRLFDLRVGFWSAVVYVTAPAVWFSSALISTDAALLTCWAGALYALVRLTALPAEARPLVWGVMLGCAVGLGLLAKYAMFYFVLSTSLLLAVDRHARARLLRWPGLVALLLAGLLIAPNILWNLDNGLSTVTHTAANANWAADRFHVDKLLEFVGAQFGVFGPLLFATWFAAVIGVGAWRQDRRLRLLVLFSLPILLIVAIQAFISRANANWAVATYVAGGILVVAWLTGRGRWWRLVPISVGIHSAVGLVLCLLLVTPSLLSAIGIDAAFKRVRGWDRLGELVAEATSAQPYTAVLTNDRHNHAALLYYARDRLPTLRSWDYDGVPNHHYEQFAGLTPDVGDRVLLVSRWPLNNAQGPIRSRFADTTPRGRIDVPLGGNRVRSVWLYDLTGFQPSR